MKKTEGPPIGPWEQEPYYNDREFKDKLQKLNAFMHPLIRWEPTKARKGHTDEFNRTITAGETYYKRRYGFDFNYITKLSKQSMDSLLYMMFEGNPHLEYMAQEAIKEMARHKKEAANAVIRQRQPVFEGNTLWS